MSMPPTSFHNDVNGLSLLLADVAKTTQELVERLAVTGLSDADLTAGFDQLRQFADQPLESPPVAWLRDCETWALVTGPIAVHAGQFDTVARTADQFLATVRLWRTIPAHLVIRPPAALSALAQTLAGILTAAAFQAALAQLDARLDELTQPIAPPAVARRRWRPRVTALPLVAAIAATMLFFLFSSIMLATQRVPSRSFGPSTIIVLNKTPATAPTITPIPATTVPGQPTTVPGQPTTVPGQPTATPGQPTATPGQPTATPGQPTATPGQPTATPLPPTATPLPPTATPLPAIPTVTVSALNHQLCNDAVFTITMSAGAGTLNWTVTSDDPTNIQISPNDEQYGSQITGAITVSQTFTIYVTAVNDGIFTGHLTVSFDRGVPAQTVSYSTTGCVSGS